MTETAPTGPAEVTTAGDIAARIDRLPLTRLQYGLASITQIYWGGVIATDGVVARLYPFLWSHTMSTLQFSILLSANIGAGILVGEYLGGFLSDRFGRKKILVASAVVDAGFLWPIALTNSFWWLIAWNFLFAIGMGFVLAVNAVYLHEIVPPAHRHKLAMRTQLLTVVVILVPSILAFFWVPSHYQWYLYALCAIELFILVPLGLVFLPESPRWLEAKGRRDEADRIVARWESRITRWYGRLDPPDPHAHPVVQTERVPASELFRGQYGRRTVLLLAVWLLGYPGVVYGASSYIPTYLVEHHWTPHMIFLYGGVGSIIGVPVVVAAFYAVSLLGERVERKHIILLAGVGFSLALLLLLAVHGVPGVAVLLLVALAFGEMWLFNMYNYTAAAYPTRLRSVGTGWTDGIGHLGTFLAPPVIGTLFTATAAQGNYGWILWSVLIGTMLPSVLIARFGIRQKAAVLEQVST